MGTRLRIVAVLLIAGVLGGTFYLASTTKAQNLQVRLRPDTTRVLKQRQRLNSATTRARAYEPERQSSRQRNRTQSSSTDLGQTSRVTVAQPKIAPSAPVA